jgi:hypothetical protein
MRKNKPEKSTLANFGKTKQSVFVNRVRKRVIQTLLFPLSILGRHSSPRTWSKLFESRNKLSQKNEFFCNDSSSRKRQNQFFLGKQAFRAHSINNKKEL